MKKKTLYVIKVIHTIKLKYSDDNDVFVKKAIVYVCIQATKNVRLDLYTRDFEMRINATQSYQRVLSFFR